VFRFIPLNLSIALSSLVYKHLYLGGKLRKFLILLTLVFNVGCATKQLVINLQEAQPAKQALDNPARYKGKSSFYIARIIDARQDYKSNEAGTGQTGILNTDTPIYLSENFETAISRSLKDRMKARGFVISESENSSNFSMVATVTNFKFTERTTMVDETGMCEMDVSFQVLDRKSKQRILLSASSLYMFGALDVTDGASSALASCVDIIVIKMINSGLI